MNDKEEVFAPFDLTKTVMYDRKTDKANLARSFYRLALLYYDVANRVVLNIDWMPVALTNCAFSCELLLKALLFNDNTDAGKAHSLEKLFNKLSPEEQRYVIEHVKSESTESRFLLCLHEQDQAFEKYRYLCEAKAISGDYKFLFEFAYVLQSLCAMNISDINN